MDFDLTEEQVLLQDTVRRFYENEVPHTQITQIYNDDAKLDRDLWARAAELGLAGLIVPPEHGGLGLQLLDLAVVAEALGYCAAPGPFLGHSLAVLALSLAGSEAQQKRYLPKLATGELIGSVALGEAGDIWQPEEWEVAVENGNISGQKKNVLFPDDADIFVVGVKGGGLALIEKGAAGLQTREVDGIDRTRRIGFLDMQQTPCEVLSTDKDVAGRIRDAGLILLAADAYGGSAHSLEFTVDYANTREQFGKTIGHFQGIKHQLADLAAEFEPSRALYWYAAYTFDNEPDDSARMAALTKSHIADRFVDTSRSMVMLHGGIGYTWEFYCQIWVKRAMFDKTYLGNPTVHRERAAQLSGW